MVVGVTNEAEGLVKKWIEEKKAKYPIAIVAGDATDKAYEVKGFPQAALVGASGKVVWTGHPGNLSESTLDEELAKAVFIPPLPAQWKEINAEIARKGFGKAFGLIEKELAKGENEALAKAKEAIEKLGADKVAAAQEMGKEGDYAGGVASLDETAKLFKGVAVAEEAAKTAKEWRADKAIKGQIAAGEDLRKAEALEKAGDPAAKKKAYSIYSDVAKKQKGTPIGAKAEAAAARLKAGG